jgi:hypothetical protein
VAAEGTPAHLVKKGTHTGKALGPVLARHAQVAGHVVRS